MKWVTQKEIAGQVGFSQQAVAFALSEKPAFQRQLRPETRRRILDVARRMGYVPNHAARRLARARAPVRSKSFDQVGLIHCTAGSGDPGCLGMMAGVEQELSRLQATLTFVRVGGPGDWEKVTGLMRAGRVDGWLLAGGVNDEAVSRLKSTGSPYVILGDHQCAQPVHCVTVDNPALGRLAVRHLASLGHRRIGFLGGSMLHQYQKQALDGFRAAVKELGLIEDERLIANHRIWYEPNGFIKWVRNADPAPTAIFGTECGSVEGMCRVLRSWQVEVPAEISLLSCEVDSSVETDRNFTRIELPMAEIGRHGASLLHRIASEPGLKPHEMKLSPTLVEGWSCCPPAETLA